MSSDFLGTTGPELLPDYFDNRKIGVGSIVMELELHEIMNPLMDDEEYDVVVNVTVLPQEKLADFVELERRFKAHERTSLTIEQLAAALYKNVKDMYTGKGYAAKAEVVVDYKGGHHMPVRIHVAG